MSGKSYVQLHQRLEDLIARGTKVADPAAGTPAPEIHKWLGEVKYCLLFLEDKIPASVLSDFRHFCQRCEFTVHEDDERPESASAYTPKQIDPSTGLTFEADVRRDFRVEDLAQINGILRIAATKLELEGFSSSGAELPPKSSDAGGPPPDDKLVAFVSPTLPASPKSVAFDAKRLREARRAISVKEVPIAKWFGITPRQYIRWESGKQAGMHVDNYALYAIFVKWAEEGNTGLPPHPKHDTPNVT